MTEETLVRPLPVLCGFGHLSLLLTAVVLFQFTNLPLVWQVDEALAWLEASGRILQPTAYY